MANIGKAPESLFPAQQKEDGEERGRQGGRVEEGREDGREILSNLTVKD